MAKGKFYIIKNYDCEKFDKGIVKNLELYDTIDLRLYKAGFTVIKESDIFKFISFKKKKSILEKEDFCNIANSPRVKEITGIKPLVITSVVTVFEKEINENECIIHFTDNAVSKTLLYSINKIDGSSKSFLTFNLALKHFIQSIKFYNDELFESSSNKIELNLLTKLNHNIEKLKKLSIYVSKNSDIEYLHDFRVTLRKIRSITHVLIKLGFDEGFKTLKKTFSEIQRKTNKARELDVLLSENPYGKILSPQFADIHAEVLQNLKRKRNKEYLNLEKILQGNDFRNLLTASEEYILSELSKEFSLDKKILKPMVVDVITKYNRKLEKSFADINDTFSVDELHRIRILCKKLRYFLEYLPDNFKKYSKLFTYKNLKKLQDTLGAINDLENQKNYFQSLRRKDESYIKYCGAVEQCFCLLLNEKLKELSGFFTIK